MREKKPKKPFMSGYKTQDGPRGNPDEWKDAFRVRMNLDEADTILGADDPRSILGLAFDFTMNQLKKAFRRLAMKWHPDLNQDIEEKANRMFTRIHAAYVKLGGK